MERKISKYIEVIPYKENYALYNKLNGILITIESKFIKIKNNDYILKTKNDEIFNYLESKKFFIDDLTVRKYIINEYSIPKETGNDVNIVISLTEKCNCSCKYCYQLSWDKNSCMLDKDYYDFVCDYLEKVINKMEQKGKLTIRYFGGEPMLKKKMILKLNKFIFEKIENSNKNINIIFEIDTNYTIMDKEFILQFPNLSIATCLSLPNDHNLLRSNSFEKTFENILETRDVFDMKKYKLNIGYNVHDNNEKDFESFLKLISNNKINCMIYFTNIVNYYGTKFHNKMSYKEFEKISIEKFYPLLYEYGFSIEGLLPSFGFSRKCSGFNTLSIKLYSNGVRSMCSLFGKDLKNVEEKETKVNPLKLNHLPDKCIKCYDYPYCGGLRPCIKCDGVYKEKDITIFKIKKYLELCGVE